jgi:agmatinase
MRTILRGLESLNFVAADIVEVSKSKPFLQTLTHQVAPAYDTNAELTTMAAADILYEVMTLMVKKGPLSVKADEVFEK